MGYKFKKMFHGRMVFVFALAMIATLLAATQAAYSAEPAVDGKEIYKMNCASCHGEKGDGMGPVANALTIKPRDFTIGSYKIRSTPNGSLPSDEDLLRTIKMGMPGTSMIPWDILDEGQRKALLPVIKGFSKFFEDEKPEKAVKISKEIPYSKEAVAKGKEVYMKKGCWECHGEKGKGDGFKGDRLKDDWGNHIVPYDFTAGDSFKGGSSDKDIYLRFTTGMTGTPMPSYEDSISVEQRWYLVHFVKSLTKGEMKHGKSAKHGKPEAKK